MSNITKADVERAKPPVEGQIFIRDNAIEGFALRITAGGTKSFVWEGRIKGRPRRLTIGQYPDLSVAIARTKVLKLRATIATDAIPARTAERNEKRRHSLS
jgi:hypothetical protein